MITLEINYDLPVSDEFSRYLTFYKVVERINDYSGDYIIFRIDNGKYIVAPAGSFHGNPYWVEHIAIDAGNYKMFLSGEDFSENKNYKVIRTKPSLLMDKYKIIEVV